MEGEGRNVVDDLLQRGIAERGEGGAIIVNLEAYGLGIFLLLKSDGASLYATKDLALAKKKFARYKAHISLHVVDSRQSLYFKQLFKTLELSGFSHTMIHVPYEFVKLKEGVISSRHGLLVRYEDVYAALLAKATHETQQRHPTWGNAKISATSRALSLAALKFGMVRVSNNQVITFDINEVLSFDGFTGPYLQYSMARIASIFKKVGRIKPSLTSIAILTTPQEQDLVFLLTIYPEVVVKACETHEPAVMAKYLYDLCRSFSSWYEACPVVSSEPEIKKARYALLVALQNVLLRGLTLLGIPPLKEM